MNITKLLRITVTGMMLKLSPLTAQEIKTVLNGDPQIMFVTLPSRSAPTIDAREESPETGIIKVFHGNEGNDNPGTSQEQYCLPSDDYSSAKREEVDNFGHKSIKYGPITKGKLIYFIKYEVIGDNLSAGIILTREGKQDKYFVLGDRYDDFVSNDVHQRALKRSQNIKAGNK